MQPDTQATIDALKSLSLQYRSEAAGKSAQADSIDLAVSQLEGTLVTQIADTQQALADAKQALLDNNLAVPDTVLAIVP